MKSLKSLTEHLRTLQLINDDAFDSWAESGRLEYSGSTVLAGFTTASILYRLQYEAVLSWEAWHGDAYHLFGVIVDWLSERDYDFDAFGFPAWDTEFGDDDVIDVEIRIRFEDSIYRIENPDGTVTITPEKPAPTAVETANVCGGADVTH